MISFAGLAGIAACLCGMGILLAGCAGQAAALRWSPLPLGLGLGGLILGIIGGAIARNGTEGPQVLAAIFTSCCGIFGGLIEMAAWLGWRTFR